MRQTSNSSIHHNVFSNFSHQSFFGAKKYNAACKGRKKKGERCCVFATKTIVLLKRRVVSCPADIPFLILALTTQRRSYELKSLTLLISHLGQDRKEMPAALVMTRPLPIIVSPSAHALLMAEKNVHRQHKLCSLFSPLTCQLATYNKRSLCCPGPLFIAIIIFFGSS